LNLEVIIPFKLGCSSIEVIVSLTRFSYKLGMVATLLALVSLPVSSAELAILRNGFAIHHQRREQRNSVTRLYLAETPEDYVDVPSGEIVRFESDELPLPPASSPLLPTTLDDMVAAASSHNNIDPDLVMSLIHAESAFNAKAVSHRGALGLMQLMPKTASWLGVEDPMDPVANLEGGIHYLRDLLARYDNDLVIALAAYNAGPRRVDQYRGVPPYPETRTYIAKIIGEFNRKKLVQDRMRHEDRDTPGTDGPTRQRHPVHQPPLLSGEHLARAFKNHPALLSAKYACLRYREPKPKPC
jgi:Transglycosylase SLT domain